MSKANYRPVSVLPCISKVFEKVLLDQLNVYFEPLLSESVSGFRRGHGCEHVLMKLVEDCKQALDCGNVAGAVLTDLSKAFDCLPHRLLIAKLHAYGLSSMSCKLMASYFSDRKQRVKLGPTRSEWLPVIKGSPQGSLMGPFTFNVHSNDLIMLMSRCCSIYNYADDNTICSFSRSHDEVIAALERSLAVMLEWFEHNHMNANPDKFQFILFDKSGSNNYTIDINGNCIKSQNVVKLLGVHVDRHLNFTEHISEMCKKAGRKLNVLCRLSNILGTDAKHAIFNGFVMSQFAYCSCIWHFCSKKDSRKIEKIQERALRYVFGDFNSTYKELRLRNDQSLVYVQRLRETPSDIRRRVYGMSSIMITGSVRPFLPSKRH